MRWLPISLVALVAVLLAAIPAGALAAEAPAEAPASEAPPPSSGWVPQTPAAEGGDDAPAPAQQGSSLGSGESPQQSPSTKPAPPPEPTPPPETSAAPYEPEPSAAPIEEEPVSAPEAESGFVPAEPPATKSKPEPSVPPAVGAADLVARSAPSGETDSGSSAAAPVANTSGASDSGGLPWLALVFCGLILLYAGMRLLLGPVEPEFFRSGRFRFVRRVFPGA